MAGTFVPDRGILQRFTPAATRRVGAHTCLVFHVFIDAAPWKLGKPEDTTGDVIFFYVLPDVTPRQLRDHRRRIAICTGHSITAAHLRQKAGQGSRASKAGQGQSKAGQGQDII